MAVRTEHWSSSRLFILAAIGSAIGFGNIWRFPYVAYENGGGAFLIPYFIALFIAGIPLMLLELGMGSKSKAGPPQAFRDLIGKKKEWIGWLASIAALLIVLYYAVIIGWAVDYAFFSINLDFAGNPEAFFFNDFLQITDGPFSFGAINWIIVLGLGIVWLWIYFSLFKGVRSVEKMVMITVTVPWLLIILFVANGFTLPGAMDGVAYYLTPDFGKLLDPDVWIAAFGQIFYTLSLAMGIMIAYASYLPEKVDITKSGIIICLANCFTSVFAGLAVFTTLGFLAFESGVPVSEVVTSGIGLAFIVYPAAISLFPVLPQVLGVLFFLMLVTLGVDSAFSLTEAVSTPIFDERPHLKRNVTIAILSVIFFIFGIFFTTGSGLYWLDIIDHYINTFLLLVVGILEVVAVGYILGPVNLRDYLNQFSDWALKGWYDIILKVAIPLVLGTLLVLNIYSELTSPYGGYDTLALSIGFFIVVIAAPIASFILAMMMQARRASEEDE